MHGFRGIDAEVETELKRRRLKKGLILKHHRWTGVVSRLETTLWVAGMKILGILRFCRSLLVKIDAVLRTVTPDLRMVPGLCRRKSGRALIMFKHIFVFFASPEGPERLSKTGPFRGTSGRGGGCYVVRCLKTPRVVKEALPRHRVICRSDGSQTGSHVNGDFPERHLLFLNLRMQQAS